MMSGPRSTPGPWEMSRDAVPEGHTQVTIYSEPSGNRVATAFQSDANARLIAAAPELLEELVNIAEFLRSDKSNDWTEELVGIDAAIAKAEVNHDL